jgi:hypothetical protein
MKMDFGEIGQIRLAHDMDQRKALVNKVTNIRVTIICRENLEKVQNWRPLEKSSSP